jgi:NADH:ubiquinone oxidoreductase subunit K
MGTILFGIFLVLHGLVHLLYFAVSRSLVDINLAGWPERSWAFSHLLGTSSTRALASALYVLATILFVVSGVGVLFRANWWNPLLVVTALFSSATFILFWDGTTQQLPGKGFVGLLLNVLILGAVFLINASVIAL